MSDRYPALVGYAYLMSGSRADAEDLVHEALVATFSRPRNLPNRRAAETYVRRAIATTFLDRSRKAGREARAYRRIAETYVETVGGPEEAVALHDQIVAALGSLTPQERACVVLRHMEQLSTKETATALHLGEGTVKRYTHDGVRKLAMQLGEDVLSDADDWVDVTSTPGSGS